MGAIATAHKRGEADADALACAVEAMVTLNAQASRQALAAGAQAATDVTGFGLLGHLRNLARESGLQATVRAGSIPALAGALELLRDGTGVSGGGQRNMAYAESFTRYGGGVSEEHRRLACDPATSGGLLVAVAADRADGIEGDVIGVLEAGEAGEISLV
jgi:selenide,water dikinase